MTPDAVAPLTVVVLTLNEERHLPECLESVAALGAPVLVLDSGSTDRTAEIARAAGAAVVERPFGGYASQRQAALGMVDTPWVLFVDADERLSGPLRAEIARVVVDSPAGVAGYWVSRRNIVWGRELRGGGWSPDAQMRLLRRGRARYRQGREVHEVVELDGAAEALREPLIHLNYDTVAEFRAKQAAYARMRVAELRREGRRPRARTFVGQPLREFWRRFVVHRGYRDRGTGLLLAMLMAWYELQTWRWLGRSGAPAGTPMTPLALPPASLDLSVVIVSYNVRDLLGDCLASVEASLAGSTLGSEVIVVDNASSDGSAELVRRRFPSVRLIALEENQGFAAGCNAGLRVAAGQALVLLNPDTRVVGDALGTLARALGDAPDIGVAGPRVRYPDGRTQPTRRRFPTRRTGFLESTLVQEYWQNNGVLRRYYVADRRDDEPQDVDWLVGACLAVRREALAAAGLLDESFFMYSEEVEWCHRLRSAGWRVVYRPQAVILHYEGASSGQNLPLRQIEFDTSKLLLYRRLFGEGTARALRIFLLATYAVRVVREGGKAVLGHKRALRRQRVALYLRALRSGLRPRRDVP